MTGLHLQDLQIAPQVILVRNEVVRRRDDDADVAEAGYGVIVVRAHEQAHVERIAQRECDLGVADERLTETRHGQGEGIPAAGELENVRSGHGRTHRFRPCPRGTAKLKRRKAVAAHGGTDVGRARLEGRPDGPAQFAMRAGSRPGEMSFRPQDEIARQASPHEVKGVPFVLAVVSGAFDLVGLTCRVVAGIAGVPYRTDVAVRFEQPEGLREGRTGRQHRP
ncbi:MAG: hypothetical protein KatS3mg043_1461 [Rhodothermaceae bacterium]|nr:MAG: hypothetical protein KatS3mg043_1461 [Rhodothermaceae bacterium]